MPAGVGHVTAAAFGPDVRPASYDGIVYTLGNSDGHLATVELALRHPGWLWLHEVRLPAIATTALSECDDDDFDGPDGPAARRAYPGRAPLEAARRAGRSNLDLIAAGVGLSHPWSSGAGASWSTRSAARRLLLLDLAPLAAHPPIHVLPPACPPRAAASNPPAGTRTRWWSPSGSCRCPKRPELLVDAVARRPGAAWPSSGPAHRSWPR